MQSLERDLDILAALKAGTTEQHAAMERIMPFFKNDFSLDGYTLVLKAFWGFFEPLERELSSISNWQSAGIDVRQRLRANMLKEDLRSLGESAAEVALIPRCGDLPSVANMDEGLGCLYVLEGSTLGGQHIAREMQIRFNLGEETGAGFFHAYGSRTGVMWRDFCSSVRNHAERSKNPTAIVAAARETFEKLEVWMRKASFNG